MLRQGWQRADHHRRHVLLGRIPPHLLGGEIPLDTELARKGVEELAHRLGLEFEACATGILEVSAWNQANALRQITVKRGLDVRDFTLVTFGGSGSLLACRLIDILGLKDVLVPLEPGNVSAFGLLTVDVRNDYVQTHVSRHDRLEIEELQAGLDALAAEAERAWRTRDSGPISGSTPARRTCAISARPSRCVCRSATAPSPRN